MQLVSIEPLVPHIFSIFHPLLLNPCQEQLINLYFLFFCKDLDFLLDRFGFYVVCDVYLALRQLKNKRISPFSCTNSTLMDKSKFEMTKCVPFL